MRHFADRLTDAVDRKKTAAMVGLDPVLERLPEALRPAEEGLGAAVAAIESFGRSVLDVVAPHVAIVKINSGFFETFYEAGVGAYYRLVAHAHERGLLVSGDVKRGDIGSTAKLYARGHLDRPTRAGVDPARIPDAVTLAGYLGENAVRPFIDISASTARACSCLCDPRIPVRTRSTNSATRGASISTWPSSSAAGAARRG